MWKLLLSCVLELVRLQRSLWSARRDADLYGVVFSQPKIGEHANTSTETDGINPRTSPKELELNVASADATSGHERNQARVIIEQFCKLSEVLRFFLRPSKTSTAETRKI